MPFPSASSERFSSGFFPSSRGRRPSIANLNTLPAPHLLRSVPFPNVISRFGKVFRVHPNTLSETDKAKLYESSQPIESGLIDVFISHSWSSPGYQKYVSL